MDTGGEAVGNTEEDRQEMHLRNLEVERKRIQVLTERLFTMRAIVPKGDSRDGASILTDAVDYVRELKQKVIGLQVELQQLDDENAEKSTSHNGNEIEEVPETRSKKVV